MVVDRTLAMVCPFFPFCILVVCMLGFVMVVVTVVAPFVGSYTWVCSNTHVSHDLYIFSQCCTISRPWVLVDIPIIGLYCVVVLDCLDI